MVERIAIKNTVGARENGSVIYILKKLTKFSLGIDENKRLHVIWSNYSEYLYRLIGYPVSEKIEYRRKVHELEEKIGGVFLCTCVTCVDEKQAILMKHEIHIFLDILDTYLWLDDSMDDSIDPIMLEAMGDFVKRIK